MKNEDECDSVLTIDPLKLLHSWSQLPKSKTATEAIQLLLSSISLNKKNRDPPQTRKRKTEEKYEIQNKRAKAELKCRSCKIVFKKKWTLIRHLNNKRLHPDKKQIKRAKKFESLRSTAVPCHVCKKKLSNRTNLLRHIRTLHAKDVKSNTKTLKIKKEFENCEKTVTIAEIVFVCEECSAATKKIDSAIEHAQLHHLDCYKPILQTCDDCKFAFELQYFADHLPNHDDEFIKINYSPKNLMHADWPEMFPMLSRTRLNKIKSSSIYEYTRKVKMNCDDIDAKPLYQCDFCELYVSPKEVEDHCKEENGCVKKQTDKYFCSDCEIYFYTSAALREHKRDHSGDTDSFKTVSFNCETDAPVNKALLKLYVQGKEQDEDDAVLPSNKAEDIQCPPKNKRIKILDNSTVRDEKCIDDEVLSPKKTVETQCAAEKKEILDNGVVCEEKSRVDEVLPPIEAVETIYAAKNKKIEIRGNRVVRISQLCCGKFILLSDLEAHKASHTDKAKIEERQTVEEVSQENAEIPNGEDNKIPDGDTTECVSEVVDSVGENRVDTGDISNQTLSAQATPQKADVQNNSINNSNPEKPKSTPQKSLLQIASMLDNFSEEMKNELRQELQKLIKQNDLDIHEPIVDSTVADTALNGNDKIDNENINADLTVAKYNPTIMTENDIKIEPGIDMFNRTQNENINNTGVHDNNEIIQIEDSGDETNSLDIEIKKEPGTESNPRPSSRYILSKMLPSTSSELDLTDVIKQVKRSDEKRKSEHQHIIEDSKRIKQILFSRDP